MPRLAQPHRHAGPRMKGHGASRGSGAVPAPARKAEGARQCASPRGRPVDARVSALPGGWRAAGATTATAAAEASSAEAAHAALPRQSLLAFTREHALAPRETRRVALPLRAAALAAIAGCPAKELCEPRRGEYALTVGDGELPAHFTLSIV